MTMWGIRGRRWHVPLLMAVMLACVPMTVSAELVPPGKQAPEIAAGNWINSPPLTMQALRGRVVLVDFWTFG